MERDLELAVVEALLQDWPKCWAEVVGELIEKAEMESENQC